MIQLVGAKNEKFIFGDWAAHTESGSIFHGTRNSDQTVAVLIRGDGIESGAVVALPDRAMPVIGAAGVNNVGNRTAAAPEFRCVGVGLDDHFADGFQVLRLNRLPLNPVVIIV